VQQQTEPEGFKYVNPYERRIMPISILSQKFAMSGKDRDQVPLCRQLRHFAGRLRRVVDRSQAASPDLRAVQRGRLAHRIPGRKSDPALRPQLLPARGQPVQRARFISGDTKLKFQADFELKLREACAKEGILVKQALVRDIEPPVAIKQPINDREIAREQILQYDQQIKVARSMALLTTQEETAMQNQKIGDKKRKWSRSPSAPSRSATSRSPRRSRTWR